MTLEAAIVHQGSKVQTYHKLGARLLPNGERLFDHVADDNKNAALKTAVASTTFGTVAMWV